MANLFELLTNAGNKIKTGLQNNAFLNNLTQKTPYIEDSNAEWDKSMALEEQKAKDEAQFAQKMQRIQNNPKSFEAKMYNLKNNLQDFNLADALLGKQATSTDSMSSDGNSLQITTSQNPRTGGILRDIAGGYQENRFTPASLENLGQNTLADGRQKGFAYKLGEGLGSVARLANSPLGRGLIVGGLVGATGGNPLQALVYGGGATALNQQNVMKDRAYRNQLYQTQADKINGEYEAKIAEIENDNTLDNAAKLSEINTLKADQQQALQNAQNQIYGMRGYMGDALFGNILRQQQLKDNAEYRKMYFDAQMKQDEKDRQWQREKFEYQKRQDQKENEYKERALDAKQNQKNSLSSADEKTYKENLATLEDINAGLELLEKNPNAYSLIKGTLPAWATNRLDPKGIATRTQIDNITAVYRKWLTGAQMSDAERKAYERFLPAPTDNYETIKAKLEGMRDTIERKNKVLLQVVGQHQNQEEVNTDPLGIL